MTTNNPTDPTNVLAATKPRSDPGFAAFCLGVIKEYRRSRDGSLERGRKWDYRFLDLAMDFSEFSKDPSTRVGAVVVDSENRIVSFGYNGLPRGVRDTPKRLLHRKTKLRIVQHAEKNAITFAERERLVGSTVYTYPFMPCAQCAGQIIQAGIVRVVAPINDVPRWQREFDLAIEMFAEAGVAVDLVDYILPEEAR